MSASNDECVAAFMRTQVCLDRIYSQLLAWAAYITAGALPPTDTAPDKAWVQQRVLAERMPASANGYVPQVGPYLLEIPNITQNIRSHLNQWNDEATDTSLSSDVNAAFATVMPTFASAVITDQDVANWCTKNGYPLPPDLVGVNTASMMLPPPGPPNIPAPPPAIPRVN